MSDETDSARARSSGPHISLAVFCEKVIEDRNGVLSLISIIDRVIVQAPGDVSGELPRTEWSGALVIGLKAGEARGRGMIEIRPHGPFGLSMPPMSFPMFFEGEDHGQNLVLNLKLAFTVEGLYWFDVLLDENLLTRIPLRLVCQPTFDGADPNASVA